MDDLAFDELKKRVSPDGQLFKEALSKRSERTNEFDFNKYLFVPDESPIEMPSCLDSQFVILKSESVDRGATEKITCEVVDLPILQVHRRPSLEELSHPHFKGLLTKSTKAPLSESEKETVLTCIITKHDCCNYFLNVIDSWVVLDTNDSPSMTTHIVEMCKFNRNLVTEIAGKLLPLKQVAWLFGVLKYLEVSPTTFEVVFSIIDSSVSLPTNDLKEFVSSCIDHFASLADLSPFDMISFKMFMSLLKKISNKENMSFDACVRQQLRLLCLQFNMYSESMEIYSIINDNK